MSTKLKSRDRLANQTIVLRSGAVVKGKNIRLVSTSRFFSMGGFGRNLNRKTLGDARVDGWEIPVVRVRGRNRWRQAGWGDPY